MDNLSLCPGADGGTFSIAASKPALWLDAAVNVGTVGSRQFDGVDQRFNVGTAIDPTTSDFWVSFWFYQTAFSAGCNLFYTGATADFSRGFLFYQTGAASLRIAICDGDTRDTTTWNILAQGAWVHVAANFDRDGLLTRPARVSSRRR